LPHPPPSPRFPYPTLFRSLLAAGGPPGLFRRGDREVDLAVAMALDMAGHLRGDLHRHRGGVEGGDRPDRVLAPGERIAEAGVAGDRKSTRLNSSHGSSSYA